MFQQIRKHIPNLLLLAAVVFALHAWAQGLRGDPDQAREGWRLIEDGALVIDVRNNGGGWTTDLLLTILTQPVHAFTVGRDGEAGYPQVERQPFYRWSRPVAGHRKCPTA